MIIRDFSLNDVEITEPYLTNAFQLERNYLLELSADRLLAGFYEIAGKTPKAERYPGGWENADIAGHTMGHYLTALAQAYATTKDTRFIERLQLVLAGLNECQAESGYLSAFPEELFDHLEQGKPAWVPWYTMHKVLSGLIRVYQLVAIPTALNIAVRLGTWVSTRVNRWDLAMKTRVLATEYGGMNDCLYELYKETGKIEYMLAAEKFDEMPLFRAIHEGQDILDGKHANTTIPKFLGALNRYFTVGEEESFYLESAERFFDMVVEHHTYVTGGNSEWEHFGKPGVLAAERTNCNCETCNTYNMLKLARGLFQVTGKKKYLDFYEGTYWNAIVSSQNPKTGMSMYFQPMATGYFKVFSEPFTNFWCCTGTGMENFTKLNDSIYYKKNTTVYVAMYISSCLTDELLGLKLTVDADLPKKNKVTIVVDKASEGSSELALRIPEWNEGAVLVSKDGKSCDSKDTEGFLRITVNKGRTQLDLTFAPTVRIHPLQDNPNVVAFTYGHLVLSAGVGTEAMETSLTGVNVTVPTLATKIKDVIEITSGDASAWKENPKKALLRQGEELSFVLSGTEEDKNLIFTPHYARYEDRYGIYFELIPKAPVASTLIEEEVMQSTQNKVENTSDKASASKITNGKSQSTGKLKSQGKSGTSHGKLGGWITLVVVLLLITLFFAMMAFSDSFRGKVVTTAKMTGQIWSGAENVEDENGNDSITAIPTPSVTHAPEERKHVEKLDYAVASCNQADLSGFTIGTEMRNGKEYLTFTNGVYKVFYKNDYVAYTEDAECEVIISNGSEEQTYEWDYYMTADNLSELCPKLGDYCANGREQLAFSFRETAEEENYLHVVAGITLDEYYFISPDSTLQELVILDSFLDAGRATIARVVGNERAYYISLPYENEETAVERYTIVQDAHLTYQIKENEITMQCFVRIGDGNYIGRISGKVSYSSRDLFQLTSPSFYVFAEDEFCDLDSMGIVTPVTEQEIYLERIPVTGDNGEKLLIPVRSDIEQHDYVVGNFQKDENGILGYYENGVKKTLTGIDVSKWQGDINWKKVADAGVDYTMIRLGYRGTAAAGNCALDPNYKQNIEGALAAGLQVGVYYFTQAITVEEAIEEANIVIENLKGYPITFPVVFDTEQATDARANQLSNADRTACAKAFCDTILNAGYTPVIYAGTNWSILKLNLEDLQGYDFWYAFYGENLYFPYEFTMWQYTQSGKIDGIDADVDFNISFIDYSTR